MFLNHCRSFKLEAVVILDKFSLEGQVGIVTGGGQGLGRAFCQAFAEAGADLVVAEINPETGPRAATELLDVGHQALFVQTDVRIKQEVGAMVAKTLEKFGRIDFLMNNAGVAQWCPAEEVGEQDWLNLMNVNLNGLFYCCQAVAKSMMARRSGKIINIASMSGVIINKPQPQTAYNTSKAAVIHLTKSLAVEWAPYNIRVNAISPGYMETPMTRPFFSEPRYGGVWVDATPMRRPGQPDELGPLAVFLASEASSFVTGTSILIDGGYTLT
jgi:NAD(P)-dependent dehydrogenase (short-subunit alcohol dehydrogenase family)